MKKIMNIFVLILALSSCTTEKNDYISRELYPVVIAIQDSTGRMDSAFVDIPTAIKMHYSILNSGDWIQVYKTTIGCVHTGDIFDPPHYTEVKTVLCMEFSRKEVEYSTTIVKFVGFKTDVPQEILDAVRQQFPDSVMIDGEMWDIQETGSLGDYHTQEGGMFRFLLFLK